MGIDYSSIGKTIKNIRMKEEMTQEQLSEYVDISPGYLSKIESGFAKPTLDTLIAISDSLGVTLNDLVYPNNGRNRYEITIGMIDDILNGCTATEKELVCSLLKAFVDFLSDRGIRM